MPTCQECGEEFEGRAGALFCSDSHRKRHARKSDNPDSDKSDTAVAIPDTDEVSVRDIPKSDIEAANVGDVYSIYDDLIDIEAKRKALQNQLDQDTLERVRGRRVILMALRQQLDAAGA